MLNNNEKVLKKLIILLEKETNSKVLLKEVLTTEDEREKEKNLLRDRNHLYEWLFDNYITKTSHSFEFNFMKLNITDSSKSNLEMKIKNSFREGGSEEDRWIEYIGLRKLFTQKRQLNNSKVWYIDSEYSGRMQNSSKNELLKKYIDSESSHAAFSKGKNENEKETIKIKADETVMVLEYLQQKKKGIRPEQSTKLTNIIAKYKKMDLFYTQAYIDAFKKQYNALVGVLDYDLALEEAKGFSPSKFKEVKRVKKLTGDDFLVDKKRKPPYYNIDILSLPQDKRSIFLNELNALRDIIKLDICFGNKESQTSSSLINELEKQTGRLTSESAKDLRRRFKILLDIANKNIILNPLKD